MSFQPSTHDFFRGGGELGSLMRNYDWANSPLGNPVAWPQSLRMAIRIMLSSRQPIWIGWGSSLIYFYNDAYKSIIGGKHPWALGRPTREVWQEIWPDIAPLLETAMGGDQGTFVESQQLIMERNGYPEETYYTFSYSPIPLDDGTAGGIFCANSDDTQRVIGERQLALLRELAARTTNARSWREACQQSIKALETNPYDLPFAMLYVGEPGSSDLSLVGSSGIDPNHPAAPQTLHIEDTQPWPVAEVFGKQVLKVVPDLLRVAGKPLPMGAWSRASSQAAILPISPAGETGRAGVLIVGLNPFRLLDENYKGFLGLAAGQIAAAIANAQAYEDERRRAEALAELDRAKTTFFSNVSHEFRTPLTLMLAPIEDLLAADRNAESETKRQLGLAHRNGMRLLRLVNSLLDFSRIEAGRMQANYEPTDLSLFSTEIASTFRSAIEKAGLELKISGADLPGPVYVDRDMWEKILLNLISNAFKFTLQGKITVSIGPSAGGKTVKVSVSDTGSGIPSEELPRVFDRFHRVAGVEGRSFEGTGIGLALVQELVKLHGGTIGVESAVGRGSTFTIEIPLGADHLPAEHVRQSETASRSAKSQQYLEEALRWLPGLDETVVASDALSNLAAETDGANTGGALPGAGKRILLADDNADMREYIRRLLAGQGYEIDAVADGEAALSALRARAPDLILTDVMMPRLDGFGVLKAVRQDPALAAIPVVLLSARAGEEAKVEGLDLGADDYLTKPFAARELLARVNSNIQLATVRREAARAVMKSEQRFQMTQERLDLALSTGRVALYDWDIKSDRLSVHGALAEVFGVSVDDARGGLPLSRFVDGILPEDREPTMALVDRTVKTGAPFETEYRTNGKGEIRTILSRGHISNKPSGERLFSGVLIDLTEERAARAALEAVNTTLEQRVADEVKRRTKAEESLRQAQKMEAIGQLTGGVAHDFNNLLTVIIGGLDTIRRSAPEDVARIQRATNLALQGAQRAASLTGRLLAFSRRQPLEPRPIELNHLVRDMNDLLHRTLGENIELEGVLAPRLWPIEVDQNQLESAILNLAVNARDAMPDGGKLTVETANTALDESYSATDAEVIPGQYVLLAMSDSGCGMSKETLSRAFEPFFTTKEVGRGTGLGLSMVYGFVKQSGGHVTVYSEEGQGTTVKLYFPRHMGSAVSPLAETRAIVPRASRGEVILVVEDSDDVRNYSVMILSELGYEVLEATNADEALQIVESTSRIDLLFTDVVLPGKNGRALADAARSIRPDLRVLYTTGYSRNAIVHHGRLDAGINLISKPFTYDELASRVRDILDKN